MVTKTPWGVVWARAAGRCQFPGCNKSLIGDLVAGNEDANFGFIAHIVAEKPNGPRGDPVRSPLLADDPANLMLLCYVHHKLIDVDEVDDYPEQRLLDIKAVHEERIAIVGAISADRATHVLRYGAKIGDHQSPVSPRKTTLAVLPDRYPAEGKTIGIEILGSIQTDGEEKYWTTEVENLRQQFDRKVRSQVEERKIEHLSVFGLAPIPLLIELGRLLGDITPADVYQLHREPPGWSWAENGERLRLLVDRPEKKAASIALKLGLSAAISEDRIRGAIGDDVAIWSVSATNPGNDVMRYKEDLQEWRRAIRSVNGEIKASASAGTVVHVFPAIPVSTAIELGRVRMPKADLPMIIYDEVPGRGFVPRLRIE